MYAKKRGYLIMDQVKGMKLAGQVYIPLKDRKWIFLAIGIAAIIVIWGLWTMLHYPDYVYTSRFFKSTFKNYGSLARICLLVVLAYYAFVFMIQKRLIEKWKALKSWAVTLSRFARKLHTPVAIIAIGLIVLHVAGAFLYGIRLDFNNVSGLLALAVLLPVPISGLFRYKRLDRKWHLRLGLAFAALFLIHSLL